MAFRKVKAHVELTLAKDMKGKKKDFYRYVGSRTAMENTGPNRDP